MLLEVSMSSNEVDESPWQIAFSMALDEALRERNLQGVPDLPDDLYQEAVEEALEQVGPNPDE